MDLFFARFSTIVDVPQRPTITVMASKRLEGARCICYSLGHRQRECTQSSSRALPGKNRLPYAQWVIILTTKLLLTRILVDSSPHIE